MKGASSRRQGDDISDTEASFVSWRNIILPAIVHNQIESQSNALATRPSRNKSTQRSLSDLTSRPNGSPVGSISTSNADVAKPRVSSDSTGSGTTVAALQSSGSRSSTEKSKAKKLFGRISVDKEGGSQGGHNSLEGAHKRSASILSHGRRGSGALDDGPGSSPNEVGLPSSYHDASLL